MNKSTYFFIGFVFAFHLLYSQKNRVWSTYYGGSQSLAQNWSSGWEDNRSVATDLLGNVYIAGRTTTISNIASGGFQNTYGGGGWDAYLVKFDMYGNRLWATYYGGSGTDLGNVVCTDSKGNVYLVGITTSDNGIAFNGYLNTHNGGATSNDAFLVKFDTDGTRLWATYFGGAQGDEGFAVCVDNSGNVYLAGETKSLSSVATTGAFDTTYGDGGGSGGDAYIAKYDSSGSLLWSTYFGGEGADRAHAICLDALNNVYIGGGTTSTTDIAFGGYQNTFGGLADNFIAKFDENGNRIWASYYGGPDAEYNFDNSRGQGIAIDHSGNIYFTSSTESSTGIAYNGFQNNLGGLGSVYLVKFNTYGNVLWATYYGGESGNAGLAIDGSDNVYLSGITSSTSNVSNNGFQNDLIGGQSNFFLANFDSSGNRKCATYFGEKEEYDPQVATDKFGHVYLAGWSDHSSGLASGGFQNTYGGGRGDAILVKFSSCDNNLYALPTSTEVLCMGECTGTATITPIGGTTPYGYSWNNGATTPLLADLCAGVYTVTVTDAANDTVITMVTITEPAVNINSVVISISSNLSIEQGQTVTLTASGGQSYSWTASDDLSCAGCYNPIASPNLTSTYCVKVSETGKCSDTACVTVYVSENPCNAILLSALLPNSFTPNQDGLNDELCIINSYHCISGFLFNIYDRWGTLVFETKDTEVCWGGQQDGATLPVGIYAYSLKGTVANKESFVKHGSICLLR